MKHYTAFMVSIDVCRQIFFDKIQFVLFLCILQQKKKLRIFISNTFYPAKHEAEVGVLYMCLVVFEPGLHDYIVGLRSISHFHENRRQV